MRSGHFFAHGWIFEAHERSKVLVALIALHLAALFRAVHNSVYARILLELNVVVGDATKERELCQVLYHPLV